LSIKIHNESIRRDIRANKIYVLDSIIGQIKTTLFTAARPPFGQKIVPIFWPGQAPTLGPEKLPQGKVFSGKLPRGKKEECRCNNLFSRVRFTKVGPYMIENEK
jgi:hypothetical protein